MNYEKYTFSKRQWCLYTGLYAAGACLAGFLFYNTWQAALVFLLVYPFFMIWLRNRLKQHRCMQLKLDFRELMTVLYSMMTAGYSLERAIEASGDELKLCCAAESDILKEVQEMCRKMAMNMPVLECFKDFALRSQDEDILTFYEVTCIARQHGGSMSLILKNAIERINSGIELQSEIETTISGKRHEFMIMAVIPMCIILYMRWTSPQLMSVLYTGFVGRFVMSVVLVFYGIAILWGEHMIHLKG